MAKAQAKINTDQVEAPPPETPQPLPGPAPEGEQAEPTGTTFGDPPTAGPAVPPTPPPSQFKFERNARLHFGSVKEAKARRNHWFADVPAGTSIDTVLTPQYWTHFAGEPDRTQIRELDLMEVFCEDGTWEGLFRVMFVGPGEVKLSVIWTVEHEAPLPEIDSGAYFIQHKGPAVRWCVINKDTKEYVQKGLLSEQDAHKFLSNHLRRLR